jgi:hypothetical protein
MNQEFLLRHYRGFLNRLSMDALLSRSVIWRVSCVIGLFLLVLRVYFIRELLAALSMVAFFCMTLLVLCLVTLLAYELAKLLLVSGSRYFLIVAAMLQGHFGLVSFVNGRIRQRLQLGWMIVSAKLVPALSQGLEQESMPTSKETDNCQVMQNTLSSMSSEPISGQPGVLRLP